MAVSPFMDMVAGRVPCYRVFEDEYTFAFLSKSAIRLGHTLIVPKVEIDDFTDVPEPYYSAVFRSAKPLARAIRRATECVRVGSVIAGWDVPHFHYHLIPMFDYYDLDPRKGREWSAEENAGMQERIVSLLRAGP